jgi:Cu/Ag efflux protein CusF
MRKLGPTPSHLLMAVALLGASLMLGACQTKEAAPPAAAPVTLTHATISNDYSATAVVAAVDAKTRVVTLRGEDGALEQVKCGEAVANFAQIGVGDTLHVKYQEILEAKLIAPGETVAAAEVVTATTGAAPGSTPSGGAGVALSVAVKVESVDLEHDIVVFSLGSGELSARRIVTPEGREFVKGLKIGDMVKLDYTQLLALTIEKV